MPKITVNNAEFYFELHGKGQPLILISGYSCDHLFWLPILEILSNHFQVLVFDNRGAGQTKDQGHPLSVELMADDTLALAHALNLNNPHIAGHSMGGTIAQTVANRYSDQIGKLIILNSTDKWRQAMILGLKSHLMMRKQHISFDDIFEAMIAWVYSETFLQDKEKIKNLKASFLENPYPQSLEDQERQFVVIETFDGRECLRFIKSSTLIISGREDLISLPYESQWMASQIPNAKWVEYDGAHVPNTPENMASLMTNFLMEGEDS